MTEPMGNRWFNLAVVLLWLASMSWLVLSKILPSLLVGDPPSYQDILAAQKNEPPVGWRLMHRGDAIGWALSVTVPLQNDLTEIRSRVHFTELPLAELAPGVIGHFLSLTEYGRTELEMDTESTLLIDSLGCLSRFDSSLRLEGVRDVIRMEGTVEEGGLKLSVDLFRRPAWRLALAPDAAARPSPGKDLAGPHVQPVRGGGRAARGAGRGEENDAVERRGRPDVGGGLPG